MRIQYGDITDPPVATEHVAAPVPISSSFSQPSASASFTSNNADTDDAFNATSNSQPIFCSTCLKNQRLFVASLAQYAPETDGDDVQLDRDYYRFRRGLEKRYPQVCADCEVVVGNAIQRAEYTAKTDHLRKMMEMSRRARGSSVYKRTTPLDWVHFSAQMVWWAATLLQILWHLKLAAQLLGYSESGMTDPDDAGWLSWAIQSLRDAVSYLPDDGTLIRASLTASVASAWWNPKFVQVSRGFTKQLSGFRQWYLFQVVICVARYFFTSLDLTAQPRNAALSAHLVIAAMTIFVSFFLF